jgi:hypothetical protein
MTADEAIALVELGAAYNRGLWRGFWLGVGLAAATFAGLRLAGAL